MLWKIAKSDFFSSPPVVSYRFEELVKKFKVEYHAGGSTQNSVKVAQVCSSLKEITKTFWKCWLLNSFLLFYVPYHVAQEHYTVGSCYFIACNKFSFAF